MDIRRVEPSDFSAAFPKGNVPVYSSVDFIELNRHKADAVHYLLLADRKVRFGIVLGDRPEALYSPFSAPFGGFVTNSGQEIQMVDEAVALLVEYIHGIGRAAEIVLPPPFYDCHMVPKYASSLLRRGQLMYADLNYHYDLCGDVPFEERMSGTARNKYRQSLAYDFRFETFGSGCAEGIARAYGVISANRTHKGYPLRMTLQEVIDTAPVVGARFMVMTLDGCDVAAAQVHSVSDTVMQLVYWGDAPGFEHLRPMNRLAPELFACCRAAGAKLLDIGPSSSGGVPSAGLCAFKESLGCIPSLKPRFLL